MSSSRTRPPEFEILVDWIEGRLEAAEAAEVADSVRAGDDRTKAAVAWLRRFLDVAGMSPLHEPPPIVRQRLRQQFARWRRARAMLDRPPLALTAHLVFDSRKDLVQAGVRGSAATTDQFHLAYRTEQADLLLDIQTHGQTASLDGQVLLNEPSPFPVFEASAKAGPVTTRTVDGDDLGRFALSDLPATLVQLQVSNGELIITTSVDLRATTF